MEWHRVQFSSVWRRPSVWRAWMERGRRTHARIWWHRTWLLYNWRLREATAATCCDQCHSRTTRLRRRNGSYFVIIINLLYIRRLRFCQLTDILRVTVLVLKTGIVACSGHWRLIATPAATCVVCRECFLSCRTDLLSQPVCTPVCPVHVIVQAVSRIKNLADYCGASVADMSPVAIITTMIIISPVVGHCHQSADCSTRPPSQLYL